MNDVDAQTLPVHVALLPLGRRVAYLRRRRGMTQAVFAERVGRTTSWADKVERGIRNLNRVSVVLAVAEVLQVPVHYLLPTTPDAAVVTVGADYYRVGAP